ncbi:MAG: hypothetical protein JWP89_1403 [Schlesneria sp.]|nr:hypothetical protein [Schlesneria sp.]
MRLVQGVARSVRTIMNASTCFLIVFGCGEVANFLHWRRQSGEEFHYHPRGSWLWIVMVILMVAMVGGASLNLVEVVAAPNFLWAMTAFSAFQVIYSIAYRHQLRKQMLLQQIAK